jgi:hypothetical protein
MTESGRVDELRELVAAWAAAGVTVPEIERRLNERGVRPDEVSKIVDSVLAKKVSDAAEVQRRKDRITSIWGIGFCIGGVAAVVAGIIWWDSDRGWQLPLVGIIAIGWGIREIIRAVA